MYIGLELIVRADPLSAVARVRDALRDGGAVVTRADRLSNKALVYHFELSRSDSQKLHDALAGAGQLLEPGASELRAFQEASPTEAAGVLHVLLVHEEPDERVPLPQVPG